MNRRQFNRQLAVGAAGLTAISRLDRPTPNTADTAPSVPNLADDRQQQDQMMQVMTRFVDDLAQGDAKAREAIAPSQPRQIAMLAYPGMFPLDLLGPLTIFSDLLSTQVHLVWKDRQPIAAGRGVQLQPIPFDECPQSLDVLFVPGGTAGTLTAMRDEAVLTFLRTRAAGARYITSVCTGSLILGAAGLLKGYRATSHWLTRDLLTQLGATPVHARVVEDRNRITGAGVTAGLDFALLMTARLAGENYAKAEQLNVEYDPSPPFHAGTVAGAGPRVSGALRRMYEPTLDAFKSAVTDAARRLS